MNIYRTKNGVYINMDQVICIEILGNVVNICLPNDIEFEWKNEEAKAFLDYLDNHLNKVFAGYA